MRIKESCLSLSVHLKMGEGGSGSGRKKVQTRCVKTETQKRRRDGPDRFLTRVTRMNVRQPHLTLS